MAAVSPTTTMVGASQLCQSGVRSSNVLDHSEVTTRVRLSTPLAVMKARCRQR
jgi:hypothetical protein